MFNWLLPRAQRKILQESELYYQTLRRNRTYALDQLSDKDLELTKKWEEQYTTLLKKKDTKALLPLNKEVDKQGRKIFPPAPYADWAENVEVFVVAGIMALAIRTFFLQPFQIPTGSMEPTLSGIEPVASHTLPPNYLVQAYDFIIHGKTYSRVVTSQGGTIVQLVPGSLTFWFEYTDVHLRDAQGNEEVDRIWIRKQDVIGKLGIGQGKIYQPGEALVNIITQTGDKVLVDKVTYNFRSPRPGDVIIFETDGIPLLDRMNPKEKGRPIFIKRCIAVAGDTVTVRPPQLFVNGKLVEGASTFAKQFAKSDDYPGYSYISQENHPFDANGETQTYVVPPHCFWAMGDNSPNSEDSRYFDGVPHANFVGKGCFVFWPFTKRWGFIP